MVHASSVAKICTAGISFVCLVAGIVLLEFATEKVHEHKAEQFALAVDSWPRHRSKFSNLDILGSFWNSGFRSGAVAEFPTSSFDDAAPIQDDEDIPHYDPLSYRMSAPPRGFLPEVKFQNIEWQETGGSSKEHGGALLRLNLTLNGNPLMTEAIPMVRARTHRIQKGIYNRCRLQKGAFANGKCWVYSRLSRICLQVVHTKGRWQFAYRVPAQNSSYGCAYESGHWTATIYKDLDLVPNDPSGEAARQGLYSSSVQMVVFDDLEIVVRSVHDPFLKALEVTNGSLDFGMTAQEEKWLAIVLLIMSVMLAVPAVCSLCFYCRRQGKKNRPRQPIVIRRKEASETIGMKYAVHDDEEEVYRVE